MSLRFLPALALGRRWLWAALPGALALFPPAGTAATNETPVLTVNQQPVFRDEFQWFMEQERAGVLQLARTRLGLAQSQDFWERKCDGTTLRVWLQTNTIQRVRREKVEQLLFKELGLIEEVSYSHFLAELERTNRERADAQQSGRIIYGPVRYTQLQWFLHRQASLRAEAKEKLANGRLAASEGQLRAAYQANQTRYLSPALSSWEIITLTRKVKAEGKPGETALATAAAQICSRLASGLSAKALATQFADRPELVLTLQKYERIDNERLAELFADGFSRLKDLPPAHPVVLDATGDAVRVVNCIARAPATLQPFNQVRSTVKARLLDQRYGEWVAELAAKARLQIDREQLDALPLQ